jgi:hypothetical protein
MDIFIEKLNKRQNCRQCLYEKLGTDALSPVSI